MDKYTEIFIYYNGINNYVEYRECFKNDALILEFFDDVKNKELKENYYYFKDSFYYTAEYIENKINIKIYENNDFQLFIAQDHDRDTDIQMQLIILFSFFVFSLCYLAFVLAE